MIKDHAKFSPGHQLSLIADPITNTARLTINITVTSGHMCQSSVLLIAATVTINTIPMIANKIRATITGNSQCTTGIDTWLNVQIVGDRKSVV